MSQRKDPERQSRAAEDAAEWILRLNADRLSKEERGAFVDWLRESPLHVAEVLRAAQVHAALGRFTQWNEIAPQNLPSENSVVPLHSPSAADAAVSRSPKRMLTRLPLSIAAGCAAVALAIVLSLNLIQPVVRTQAGERRELTLSDGSVVSVAPASVLKVRFTRKERHVLLDHGQALFKVAKNPQRPFVVDASGARVRAVGTAFSVESESNAVVVTVVEGKVMVSQNHGAQRNDFGARSSAGVQVAADEQVEISDGANITPVKKINSHAAVAWSQGQLIFDNDTVANVIRRFNRYNRTQIRIVDSRLESRRVSGVFTASDPQSFVEFLKSAADADSVQITADEIVIGMHAARDTANVTQ